MKESRINTAILGSGSGSTAEAIMKAHQEGRLFDITPTVIITNSRNSGIIRHADHYNIPAIIVPRSIYSSPQEYGEVLAQICKYYQIDLVSQNGWMVLTPENFIRLFKNRIINQHPGALDPATHQDFGGEKMYGATAIGAHLAYNWITGETIPLESTVHHVTANLDEGRVITVAQLDLPTIRNPIAIADLYTDPTQLIAQTYEAQQQLLPLEHENVIGALHAYEKNGHVFPSFVRAQPLIKPEHIPTLIDAKKLAVTIFQKK